MSYYTTSELRADLAGIAVNLPEGYIGTQIYHVAPVAEKAGSVAYATVQPDAMAQVGRPTGVAPVATQIANSVTQWSCAEIIDRAAISPDEVKQMGGLEKADEIGARWAMRQVLGLREARIAAEVLSGAASAVLDVARCRTQMQEARHALRLYPGRSVLVGATYTLTALVQRIAAEDVGQAFSRLVTGTDAAEAALGLSFAAWKRGLALFFGLDDVLAGDDAIWGVGDCAEKLAVVKVDNTGDPLSHKYIPVVGKTFTFIPDGGNGWEVQSVGDRTLINNFYDAKMWVHVKTLNPGAVYRFEGVTA